MPGKGNLYNFYETPARDTRFQSTDGALNSTKEETAAAVQASAPYAYQSTAENREIYINNKNRIINIPEGMDESEILRTDEKRIIRSEFNF